MGFIKMEARGCRVEKIDGPIIVTEPFVKDIVFLTITDGIEKVYDDDPPMIDYCVESFVKMSSLSKEIQTIIKDELGLSTAQ